MAERLEDTIEDISKGMSAGLRGKIIATINDLTPLVLHRLNFVFDRFGLTGDYKIILARKDERVPLNALSEGERNAIGMAIKLALIKECWPNPLILCYDDCLSLDEDRFKTFKEYLEKKVSRPLLRQGS